MMYPMNEETKIETKQTSVRLPIDILETLQRWSEEQGQSVAQCITTLVRVAAEDEKRIPLDGKIVSQETSGIQDVGYSILQIPLPKRRDDLANAITTLLKESEVHVGERDQVSALGVARARVYKATREYQTAQLLRDKAGIQGVYEDEQVLADRLSGET
jgi:hypothetical protein